MSEFVEIIKTLTPIVTGLLTLGGLWIKMNSDAKKQKQREDEKQNVILKELEKRDAIQTANMANVQVELTELQRDIEWLRDIHKYRGQQKKLFRKLEHIIDDYAGAGNKEIHRILGNGLEKIKPLFADFFDDDFEGILNDKVYDDIKRRASSLRPSINVQGLNLRLKEGQSMATVSLMFMTSLKDSIKPYIKTFSRELEEISKEKINGERVEAFSEIARELVKNVTSTTLQVHSDFQKDIKQAI